MNAIAKDKLAELREQREAAQLAAEISQFEAATRIQKLANSQVYSEGFFGGGLVDPRTPFYDTPEWNFADGIPQTQTEDMLDGDYNPFFQTEIELNGIRGIGRLYREADGVSINIIENLTNYILDTGFSYTAEAKKGKEVSDRILNAINDTIDEFNDLNQWTNNLDRILLQDARAEGENILVFLDKGKGRSILEAIPGENLTEPQSPADLEDHYGLGALEWKYGIGTEPGSILVPQAYFIEWQKGGTDWEMIMSKDVVHRKLNVPRKVKRGLSDFYSTFEDQRRNQKLFEFTTIGATIQASIAYVKEALPAAKPLDVSALGTGGFTQADVTIGPNGEKENRNFSVTTPGQIVQARGYKYQMGPLGQSNAPSFIEITKEGLRQIGIRWQMPEYMITGDASNNNLASSVVAGGPFDKATRSKQESEADFHKEILWKVIERARKSGGRLSFLSNVSINSLKRKIEINIETPEVAPRDFNEEEQRRKLLNEAGILSKQSWSEKAGLDYDIEKERIDAETEEAINNPNDATFAPVDPATLPPVVPGQPAPGKPMSDKAKQAMKAKLEQHIAANWDTLEGKTFSLVEQV